MEIATNLVCDVHGEGSIAPDSDRSTVPSETRNSKKSTWISISVAMSISKRHAGRM